MKKVDSHINLIESQKQSQLKRMGSVDLKKIMEENEDPAVIQKKRKREESMKQAIIKQKRDVCLIY